METDWDTNKQGFLKLNEDIYKSVVKVATKKIIDHTNSVCSSEYQFEVVRKLILDEINEALRNLSITIAKNYKIEYTPKMEWLEAEGEVEDD